MKFVFRNSQPVIIMLLIYNCWQELPGLAIIVANAIPSLDIYS